MIKVSVIVPVYNASKTLKRCVDSILKQDYRDFELILVDDGSQDDSCRLMNEYAASDSRVKAVSKTNGGVSSARNLGLDIATGDCVQFVDSDDWLPMEAVKLLVREKEQFGSDMVIGDFFRVFEGKISVKGSISAGGVITRDQYAEAMLKTPADLYYGVLWNKLYRRDLIEEHHIRMDEKVSYGEDMIFNLEYLLHVETIAVLKVPVYYYIRMPGSLIEQNVSLSGIINMKRTVVRYYDRFYKTIFDEQTYQERRLVILSYVLAFSTDALTLPLIGGSRDLGKERGADIPFSSALQDPFIAWNYLNDQLICKYLQTIGIKRGISLNEMRILFLLWRMNRPCSMEEISSYSGMIRVIITMSMVRLTSSGLVKRASLTEKKKPEGFVFSAPELEEPFQQLEKDYEAICFEDFTEEEKSRYIQLSGKMLGNIRRHIVQNDLGNKKD